MSKKPQDVWFNIFRAGCHTASNGTRHAYTTADLDRMVANYNRAADPAPIVVGHPATNDHLDYEHTLEGASIMDEPGKNFPQDYAEREKALADREQSLAERARQIGHQQAQVAKDSASFAEAEAVHLKRIEVLEQQAQDAEFAAFEDQQLRC